MRSIIVRLFFLFFLFFPALSSAASSSTSLTGLWWNPSESGWGMSLTQQGTTVFVAWYTYDSNGKPVWYVMSSCPVVGNGCTGDIYSVKGGTPLELPWNGNGKAVTKAGTGTLAFTDNDTGTFNYSVNGVSGTKNIARQVFATGTSQPTTDYSALWWNESESGWGVALTQQYETIFATMYSYDASGNPVWYVASSCPLSGSGCTGDLYQVTGGSAPTVAWSANLAVTKVGTVSFALNDSCTGTMTYTINGVTTTKAITNQLPAANQCTAGTVAAKTTAGICAATLSQDLTLQIPKLAINGSSYNATLKITQTADGIYTAKTTSFEATSRTDCSEGDAGIIVISNNTYVLHVPSLIFGTSQYWINFEYAPTSGESVSLINAATAAAGAGSTFKLTKYGNAVTGVTGEGSAYLSLTQVTVNSVSSAGYQVKESFPGGTEANVVVTVLKNQTYTPTAEETALVNQLGISVYGAKFTHSEADGNGQLLTQYFVPNSVLPASVKSEPLQATMPATILASAAKSQKSAVSGTGTSVAIDVSLVGIGKQQLDNLASMGFSSAGRLAAEAGSSTLDMYSAMLTEKNDYRPSRFAELQACDPAAAARLMDEHSGHDMARGEAADYIDRSVGSVFINKPESGGTETIQRFSGQARTYAFKAATISAQEIETALAACKKGYEVDWSDGANHIWGTICSGLDNPFTLNFDSGGVITGAFAFAPASLLGGTVSETGSTAFVTYSGGGTYAVSGTSLSMSITEQKGTMCTPLGCQTFTLPGISNTLELVPTSKCS